MTTVTKSKLATASSNAPAVATHFANRDPIVAESFERLTRELRALGESDVDAELVAWLANSYGMSA